jgi:lipoyl(octanoyl) transferase
MSVMLDVAAPVPPAPAARFAFEVRDLGRLDYREAWDVQRATHAAVAEGRAAPTLLLVEHPPVITFGRKGGREHLLVSEDALRERGFSLYDIERGGDVTYHGPGQLVGYPIFPVGRRVRDFLRDLEGALVEALATFGVATVGSPGYAGVWAGDAKVVAIGIAIQRHVSFHGFAMNVHTDLSHFETIVPCGLHDKRVTSLSELLGRPVTLDEVKPRVIDAFGAAFGPLREPQEP